MSQWSFFSFQIHHVQNFCQKLFQWLKNCIFKIKITSRNKPCSGQVRVFWIFFYTLSAQKYACALAGTWIWIWKWTRTESVTNRDRDRNRNTDSDRNTDLDIVKELMTTSTMSHKKPGLLNLHFWSKEMDTRKKNYTCKIVYRGNCHTAKIFSGNFHIARSIFYRLLIK
jgi:hypothetical protein